MPIAHVFVDADRSARVRMQDSTELFSDLGAAMSALSSRARDTHTAIQAELRDGNTARTLVFDANGRLSAKQSASAHPAADTHPSAAQADPAPATPTQQDENTSGSPSTSPQAPASPQKPLHAPPLPSSAPSPVSAPAADTSAPESSTDPHSGSYPTGDRYSGPALPDPESSRQRRLGRNGRTNRNHRRAQEKQPARGRGRFDTSFSIPGIVLAILLVAVVIAYFLPNLIGPAKEGGPQSIPVGNSTMQSGQLSLQDASEPVPGFPAEPSWEAEVPQTASVTASERGVVVMDGNNLRILDAATGQERYQAQINDRLEFVVDTQISGSSALVWRAGDTAWALFDGSSSAREYSLPAGARMSSAGNSVIIKVGDELKTFGPSDLVNLPTPETGSTPMALDGDTLISAKFEGPLTRTNITTGAVSEVELEKPADNLKIIRWVSAGFGKVVTLWGEPGANTSSGHRIQLVVSNAETGKIASTVETTTDVVGEATWVRGQGHQLATIGPYLFSMTDGLLVRDGTADEITYGEPRGDYTPATFNDVQTLIQGDVAWQTTTNLLAVAANGTYAVARTSPTSVSGYVHQ